MEDSTVYKLSSLIRDRDSMHEHADLMFELEKKYSLKDVWVKSLLQIETMILAKKDSVTNLPTMIQAELKCQPQIAGQIAADLWGGYFLFFQDFLGKVDDLIVKNGGDLKKYQDRARQLLSPHRQLQEFVTPYLYDFHLENAGDAVRNELIDIILDRSLGKLDEKGLIERLSTLFAKASVQTKAEDAAEAIENLLVAGDISKEWGIYYMNLAENILSGTPSSIEVKKEQKVAPIVKEQVKEKVFLTNEEIGRRLQEIDKEMDVMQKIQKSKTLLESLDLHAMRKAEMYDKITHAESLLEHRAKTQNSLEKKAIQDELHDLVEVIAGELKSSAEAPASTEEIQRALRDLKNE